MDQHRDLAMREDLYRLAAEHNRRDAVTAMRRHDNPVAAFQARDIDDRLVGMLMFDLDRLARNACCLRRGGDRAQRFLSMLLHTCFVLSWRVLDHLRVGGERMKGLQDRQHGNFDPDPLGQSDTGLTAFPASFEPSVGIWMLAYMGHCLNHDFFSAASRIQDLTSRAVGESMLIRDGALRSFLGRSF